jgi:hypothetical protein
VVVAAPETQLRVAAVTDALADRARPAEVERCAGDSARLSRRMHVESIGVYASA